MSGEAREHIMVRMAAEGIPMAAIARALLAPYIETRRAIERAYQASEIPSMPAVDWPEGTRFDRRPATAPFPMKDIAPLAAKLQGYLRMAPGEARFLAALMLFGQIDLPTMREIASRKGSVKVVTVYAHHVRKILKKHRIKFETLWGRGYMMAPAEANKVRALVAKAELSVAA